LAALRVELREGDRIEARGNLAAYTARSQYQIIVDSARPAGLGDLMRRFIELRDKLKAEGLFEAERKRPLPALPRTWAS
jgi:exodeoxyribonuclease VII large subunit